MARRRRLRAVLAAVRPPQRGPDGYPAGHPQPVAEHGQDPYGQVPYAQVPYGQDPYAQDPYGRDAHGPSSYGQEPQGQAGYQQTSYQQTSYGQSLYSQVPDGGYSGYGGYQDQGGQELYAPPGVELPQDGYLLPEPPVREQQPEAAGGAAADAVAADTDPAAEVDAPGARTRLSLVGRARAAADAVVSADHTPGRRTLAIRAGAGVAALAVLVTAGVMVSGESGGSGGSVAAAASGEKGFTVAHAKIWTATPAAEPQAGADDTLLGSWLLGDAVVRAESTGVHAYGLADGKATWSLEPPAPGAVPCGLSPTVNAAGLGAAVFRTQADPRSPCTLVAAVDTRTGRTAWTKTLSDTKDQYTAHVGVTEDKVIAVGDDKALAWQAADGADVWQYTGQGKFCTLSGGVQGKTVLLHSSCADSTPVDQAVSLNTADGKVSWWRGLNNQPKTVTVLSAEPAVVVTTGERPADDRIFAWGTAGDPAAEIPVTLDGARIDAGHGSFSATPGMFFQDHVMAVTLAPESGGPLSIAAFDVTTGKQLWKAPTAEKGKVRAVGLDNGALLLAADERLGQPARLSRFALAGGQETVGGNFPQGTGSLLIAGRVLIGSGTVVAVPEHSATFGTAAGYQARS